MMIQGQKKSELVLYVVLWAILFAAAALSVYWDGLHPTPEEMLSGVSAQGSGYDWIGLMGTWKFLAMFCFFFFIHNFLIAPLLVYRNKKWLYGIGVFLLMGVFAWYTLQRSDKAPKPKIPHREIGNPPPPKYEPDGREKEPNDLKAKPFGGPNAVAFNIMLLLLGLNVGAKYYFKSLDDRKRMKELERDNLNQQLQYLKYQINPHFFMNTLNNIHALVDIDPEEAKHTIEVLSKLMRYVLYDADKPMTPLQKELDFMRIHKSFIINLHHIVEINRSRVVLDDGAEIPIGDSYRDKLNDYVCKKFLGK